MRWLSRTGWACNRHRPVVGPSLDVSQDCSFQSAALRCPTNTMMVNGEEVTIPVNIATCQEPSAETDGNGRFRRVYGRCFVRSLAMPSMTIRDIRARTGAASNWATWAPSAPRQRQLPVASSTPPHGKGACALMSPFFLINHGKDRMCRALP